MVTSTSLQNFIDDTARTLFNMTVAEAHEKGMCINCKSPIRFELGADETGENGQIYSDAGAKEYGISGMCETCYDSLWRD